MATTDDVKARLKNTPATTGGTRPATVEETVRSLIDRQRDEIARALPTSMDPDRFARVVLTTVRSTPDLLEVPAASLLGAIMLASQLGLEPGGPLGQCYIIPRKLHGSPVAQFQLGYRGIIDLAYRGGRILNLEAHEVYSADRFDFAYGLTPVLEHRPSLDRDRGEPVAYYSVARFTNGGATFRVMSLAEVEAIRDRYGYTGKDSAWVTAFDSMARKTVIRAMAPFLPLSAEAATGIAADGATPNLIAPNLAERDDIVEAELVDDDPAEDDPDQDEGDQ